MSPETRQMELQNSAELCLNQEDKATGGTFYPQTVASRFLVLTSWKLSRTYPANGINTNISTATDSYCHDFQALTLHHVPRTSITGRSSVIHLTNAHSLSVLHMLIPLL